MNEYYQITPSDVETLKARVPELSVVVAALRGRKGLRTAKPKDDSLMAYLWRMARFHSGADVTMPMMAQFDLNDWVAKELGKERISYLTNEEMRSFMRFLDEIVDKVIINLGGNPYAAAARWGRALGRI